ncbi:hypothetical protein ACFQZC_17445 [Streptacidiphilus monticola]
MGAGQIVCAKIIYEYIIAEAGEASMWEYQHSVETSAAPGVVWGIWAEVERWGEWNADIEKIELRGGFVDGGEITMVPAGQEPVELTLAQVLPGQGFVDEAVFGGSCCAPRTPSRRSGRAAGSPTAWRSPGTVPTRSDRRSGRASRPTGRRP